MSNFIVGKFDNKENLLHYINNEADKDAIIYLNLPNSLEFADKINNSRFIKLNEFYFIHNMFDKVLNDLGTDFLYNAIAGKECILVYTNHLTKEEQYNLIFSFMFIHFILVKFIFNYNNYSYYINEKNVKNELKRCFVNKQTKRKLKFLKKFSNGKELKIKLLILSEE